MTTDELYMSRACELAMGGVYHAAPNPQVGAVIVCDGKIIGEGFHRRCGGPHAEVNAIASVRDESLLQRSTIYVTLEPCSHYGKTPPCADLIVSKRIPRVVVGCVDPFSKVSGNGIRKLREAGIEVTVGVLEDRCRRLIERFVTFHTQQRPYITLKWAESADGFIDVKRDGGSPHVISCRFTSMLVHRLRARHQAIMVGRNTALADNPSLTTRLWPGGSPLRVVTDRNLVLPHSLKLFDGTVPTLVFTCRKDVPQLDGADFVTLPEADYDLPHFMTELHRRGVQSLLVEGGRELLQSFIDCRLWDEAHIETGRCVLHDGVEAPVMRGGVLCESRECFGALLRTFRREV